MILKVLGIFDLFIGISFLLQYFEINNSVLLRIIITSVLFAIIKFYFFHTDFSSYVDVLLIIYLLAIFIIGLKTSLTIILSLWFFQKSLMSLIL
jgi:hypothetical protein